MLSNDYINEIRAKVQAFWQSEVSAELQELLQGKELGHRIADFVDDKTTFFLQAHFRSAQEHNRKGEIRARSMGDIWMEENGIYHPVNVKAGMVGSEGQPNMVSLNKLIQYLINHSIDSYYLLMIKISKGESEGLPTASVYMIDMLDIIDYLTFDAGPGQIMLKAKSFFRDAASLSTKKAAASTIEKVNKLTLLLEDGERRLKINRDKRLIETRKSIEKYLTNDNFFVVPDSQVELRLS